MNEKFQKPLEIFSAFGERDGKYKDPSTLRLLKSYKWGTFAKSSYVSVQKKIKLDE
jgi:hypothetical protein